MKKTILASMVASVALIASAQAQGPMRYGPEISLADAKKAVAAAMAEAQKNNWPISIAVVGPSGHLVLLEKMENTQFASIKISEHKARVAATYRRPTKALADAIGKGAVALLSLDDVIASPGGIPIVKNGMIVGAIGCSGVTGDQDHQACQMGVDAIK